MNKPDTARVRCPWAMQSEIYMAYHDEEWGTPLHDERRLFELLLLEGQQAGLSWITILNKRENFRLAYDGFDPEVIARYDENKCSELLQNSGIIRNRLKIQSAISNARAYLSLCEEQGSLNDYLWAYVDGEPIVNHWHDMLQVPAATPLSDAISKDMKKRGFTFIGSTIIYAYMQSTGMVDDHLENCFRRVEMAKHA